MTGIKKKSAVKKSAPKKTSTRKAPSKKEAVAKVQVKKRASGKTVTESVNSGKQRNVSESRDALVLDPVLTINDARKLYQNLGELLENNDSITIDASSVEMVDTAMLQLLLAFAEKTRSSNKSLHWINPSQVLIGRAEALNVSEKMVFSDVGNR